MPSLADVVQQMGPSIIYDERTKRFHDMEQNYRMVSTQRVVAGNPIRADGRGASNYVTQDAFNSFQAEIYLYIGKVAFFTREALVEMQKTMVGEQRDTESLREDERRIAEEKRERRRELISGAMTRVSSGIRRATGMGPLGALFTGLFAGLTAVLANVNIERLRQIFNNIESVFNNVRSFFNRLREYSTLILAIGAALATMVAANMLNRTRPTAPRPSPPRPSSPPPPRNPPTTPNRPAPTAQPSAAPRPSTPPTTPGTPTSTPPTQTGTPERAGRRNTLPRRMIRAGALGAVIDVIPRSIDAYRLIQDRNEGNLSQEEFRQQMIELLGTSIGGMTGAAAGSAIGTLLGPVGTIVGGIAGGLVGSAFGPDIAQALFRSFLDENEAPDDFYQQMARGAEVGANMQTELSARLARLRNEGRQRVLNDEEMVNTTQRAVNEGRISQSQAAQINEIGSQAGTIRRAGDIEAVIEAISSSGLEGANSRLIAGRENRTGRVIVLPPYYQESIRPNTRQNQPAPAPSNPAGIQTRNSDSTLEDAQASAAFMNAAF